VKDAACAILIQREDDAFLGIDDPDRVLALFEPSKRGA